MVMEKDDVLYSQYAAQPLTYTGEVAAALGLVSDQVRLTLGDREFPCGLHTCSFTEATLLLKIPDPLWSWVSQAGPDASLTVGFQNPDETVGLSLFRFSGRWSEVKTHVTADLSALVVVLFEFTRVPPVRFIELQGTYLETRSQVSRRREARLRLTETTAVQLGIRSLVSSFWLDGVEYLCVLRELSVGGGQLVLSGRPESFLGRDAVYRIPLGQGFDLMLRASVVRADPATGHTGFAVLGLQHDRRSLTQPFFGLLTRAVRESQSSGVAPATGGAS